MRLASFLLSGTVLAVTAGLAVPSMVIESSAADYFYVDGYTSPSVFLQYSFLQAVGLFLVWPGCLYALFPSKVKDAMAFAYPCLMLMGLVDCFAFSGDYGPMNANLTFMQSSTFMPTTPALLANLAALVLVAVAAVLCVRLRPAVPAYASAVMLVAVSGLSVWNCASIMGNFRRYTPPPVVTDVEPVFHLSKTERNVIVIMEDRCLGSAVPDIFEEQEGLYGQYDGFVYYPNTISLSYYTQVGVPGLFGGYEYTPWEMNRRTGMTLREKHNESLLVMPTIFTGAGWNVFLSDMPYENYGVQPAEAIYSDLPDVHRVKCKGAYTEFWYREHGREMLPSLSFMVKRNLLFFSIFKLVPPCLRQFVYSYEYYLSYNPYEADTELIDSYAPLEYLPRLTACDGLGDTFMVFDNELTHTSAFLQAPGYVPQEEVTDYGSGPHAHDKSYHVNCAALLRLGEFFDYLRQNGCYDNTRIIIVSDHGAGFPSGRFDNETQHFPFRKENIQAALLVKDFGARGTLRTDMTFMTNADTPQIALAGVVEEPVNPFTGAALRVDKDEFIKIAFAPMQSLRARNDARFAIGDDEWYTVHDDIFEDKNWARLPAAE